jgi:hypothetical protein
VTDRTENTILLQCNFCHEDVGDIFLRNTSSYKNHMAPSYPRRKHSSLLPRRKHQILPCCPLWGGQLSTHSAKQRLVSYNSTVTARHIAGNTVVVGSLPPSVVRCILAANQGNSESFHPEDGADMFLRNAAFYKNHAASSYPRRQHSSLLPPWKHYILHGNMLVCGAST